LIISSDSSWNKNKNVRQKKGAQRGKERYVDNKMTSPRYPIDYDSPIKRTQSVITVVQPVGGRLQNQGSADDDDVIAD